jgi:hypothetical protein
LRAQKTVEGLQIAFVSGFGKVPSFCLCLLFRQFSCRTLYVGIFAGSVAHDRLEAITAFSFRRYLCNHLPVETTLKEIVFVAWGWNLALISFADQSAPNVHLRHGIAQTLNIQGLARTYGKKVEDLPPIPPDHLKVAVVDSCGTGIP